MGGKRGNNLVAVGHTEERSDLDVLRQQEAQPLGQCQGWSLGVERRHVVEREQRQAHPFQRHQDAEA